MKPDACDSLAHALHEHGLNADARAVELDERTHAATLLVSLDAAPIGRDRKVLLAACVRQWALGPRNDEGITDAFAAWVDTECLQCALLALHGEVDGCSKHREAVA